MKDEQEHNTLFLAENNVLNTFCMLSIKLRLTPYDKDLEGQTVHLLSRLLCESAHQLFACDALRKTRLLNVVVGALGSRSRLCSLAANGDSLREYIRVLELASEVNPYECMRHLTLEGRNYSGLYAFLPLLVRLPLLDGELSLSQFCFNSFVRTVSLLFSDAKNCALLARMKPSPMQLLLESFTHVPAVRSDVRLIALRGVLQVLLYTSEFTKIWVEAFSIFNGPATSLLTVVEWCSMHEDPRCCLNETSTVLFDILCLILSLPDKGREPSYSLYMYLRSFHWDVNDTEPGPSIYTSTLGSFGLCTTVRASLAAMEHRPALFPFLARLLINVIRIGSVDIVAAGLVSEDLVSVLREYLRCCCADMEEKDVGAVITTIVHLCILVSASSETYAKQNSGAPQICSLVVELASSPVTRILIYTIKNLILLSGFRNEKFLFSRLVSMQLFEELEKKLQVSSNLQEIQVVLKIMKEICSRVPFLQGHFLPISDSVINLIRTKVENGIGLLNQCAHLLSLVMIHSGDDAAEIGISLQRMFTQTDFQSNSSIISGCWAMQTCIRSMKRSAGACVYVVSEVENILICLNNLCVNMGAVFSLEELLNVDVCELYDRMLAYHRHQRDAGGMPQMVHRYLLLCDFLLLALHLLSLLHVNDPEVLRKFIVCKLEGIITAGPFLRCRLYTSIIARAFFGMCSLSSYVFVAAIRDSQETTIILPITRQDLTAGWDLQTSYGDDLFACNKQRIVHSECLQSLFNALLRRTQTAQSALLGASIVELLLDMFSNCHENICVLLERRTVTLLAELLAVAIAEDNQHMSSCFERLVAVTRHTGSCGFNHSVILYLLQMCLRGRTVDSVEYENVTTKTVLSAWKFLLQDSIPSAQPMSFLGISAGFPTITRYHTSAVSEIKKNLELYGGVDIPIQLVFPRNENGVSAVLWFFVERNFSLEKYASNFVLLSLFFDQNNVIVLLYLSEDGALSLKVMLRGHQGLRSRLVPLPNIEVPKGQWCMIFLSIVKGPQYSTSFLRKMRLDVRARLYTAAHGIVSFSTEVSVHVEIVFGLLGRVEPFFQEVNMISFGGSCSTDGDHQQQLLFGTLGIFAGSLSSLEVSLLFAMGSDSLFCRSFMDKSFVIGLCPVLINMLQQGEKKIMGEMMLLSAMWIRSGIQGTEGQLLFSGSFFPFNKYCNKERFSLIVGVVDGELCIEAHTERRGVISDGVERQDMDGTLWNTALDRLTKMRFPRPISLKLSCDESDTRTSRTMWTNVNGPRFLSVTPAYSVLDAVGGISFFLWLASLQAPHSEAFEEAWECVCSVMIRHSTESLFFSAPSDGGCYLVVLLRAMLHSRIVVSSRIAASFCEVVGHQMIVRIDLLPLMLDFTLWSQDADAFRVILRKLQQYVVNYHYGPFNSQILQGKICSKNRGDECYALDEFLLHLLLYFEGVTNGNWDSSLISYATSFLISLCRKAFHLKQIVQAVLCLVKEENILSLDAVEWALGLLNVANSIDVSDYENLRDECFVFDVLSLLRCSHEMVRCKALCLLSRMMISWKQLNTMVDEYLTRKTCFPDFIFFSEREFVIVVDIIKRSTCLSDIKRARAWCIFLLSLFMHLPHTFQIRVLQLLRDTIEAKGLFLRELVYPAESNEHSVGSIPGYMIGILSMLPQTEVSMIDTLVELLASIAVYMLETSWGTENVSCGRVLCDVASAVVREMLIQIDSGQRCINNVNVRKTGALWNRFSAPCFYIFTLLTNKGHTEHFANEYFSFLETNAAIVILMDWCEVDNRSVDGVKVTNNDEIPQTTLACTYLTCFEKLLSLGDRHTGLRLAMHVFECARRLFFTLKVGDVVWMSRTSIRRLSDDLLLLQWKIIATLLYNAEKNDDDVVKELLLLHLAYSGNSEYGVSFSAWEKQRTIVQPPKGADWKHVRLSSNTLLTETLKGAHGEALKDLAPWLIILRAAFSFLHLSMRDNQGRYNMALSICRFIRYNASIWSLVKGGILPSSIAELDATLKTDCQAVDGWNLSLLGDSLWVIELSRNGVAALEKYVTTARSFTLSLLRQCDSRTLFPLLTVASKQTAKHQDEISSGMHMFQASFLQKAALYKKYVEEDGNVILAAHAAYRFSLLPWWGHCISLYANTPVPLNRWELDRFMGTEWQRIRLRRFIHNVKIIDTACNDRLLSAVYRDGMNFADDVRLLRFYSVTAVPQLLRNRVVEPDLLTVNCKLVLPMDRVPIILYVTSRSISYVAERFQHDLTQLGMKHATDNFSSCGSRQSTIVEVHCLLNRLSTVFKNKHEIPSFRRVVEMSSIRAVWPRRNLLQPFALELLFFTGETLFLAFDSESLKKSVFEVIVNMARPYLDRTLILTENNLKLWRNWWCEGRISNFHYLMYLNFAAGRSYGDLRQYPIFPHVVADFASDSLDLMSVDIFRCFGKPMGAQTRDRELRAIAKYKDIASLTEMEQNVPINLVPHHYGSHYSPLGGALHYLVRVQPFSDYFMDMNSELDDAGRVFDSMATAYTISTGRDVKELVPEFYCLPEVFVNSNRIPFGIKQDGQVVDDVQLPPWASTPRELTQKLRQALESRYTSENLHLWIDLIFGHKQRGKEAVAAVNVFHPLTYEGSVNLSTISDPVLRNSHETQIDCFGQTPLQLFTHPHKPRGRSADPSFFQSPCPTLRYEASSSHSCGVLHPEGLIPINIFKVDGRIAVFPRARLATAARGAEEGSEWKLPLIHTRPIALPRDCLPFSVINDQLKECLCIRGNCIVLVDGKDLSREIASFHVAYGRITSFTVDSPNVYVGMESGAIHVCRITSEESSEVDLSVEDENGKRINMMNASKKILHGDLKIMRSRSAVQRCMCIFYGHTAPVIVLCVSPEWGILVSSAKDYNVGVWDIARHVLLRTIPYPGLTAKYPESLLTENLWRHRRGGDNFWQYNLIAVNAKEGDIILAGSSAKGTYAVRLYTINGSLVCAYDLGEELATAILSVGGVVFIAQGMIVRVLKERNLRWLCNMTHPGIEDSIESLALSPNGLVLAACDRKGNLVTWKVSP